MSMALHHAASSEAAGSSSSRGGNNNSSGWSLSRPIPLRRRRSKGTTVSFIDENSKTSNGVEMEPVTSEIIIPSSTKKPSHSARISLACINGAVEMGDLTRKALTPPDRREEDDELTSGDEEEVEEEGGRSLRVARSITERPDGSGEGGKLAFGQRKIKYFDQVTAQDREAAREFLRDEMSRAKRRDREGLLKHLKREQAKERRKRRVAGINRLEDVEEETNDMDDGEEGGSSTDTVMPSNMSLSLSAALVLESLALTPLESIEGMAKCYEGFVAAGTALLDEEDKSLVSNSGNPNPNSQSQKNSTSDSPEISNSNSLSGNANNASRSSILDSLASLLITTLSQMSGDVILALAELCNMCGTSRYRRRFVQRISPVLIRPPNAAIWCLRHQNDMAAIMCAVELMIDSASDIFSLNWKERGRLVKADDRRSELLDSAARQLKSLSSGTSTDAPSRGPGTLHRRNSGLSFQKGVSSKRESPSQLADWEVLAVDRHIRLSLSNLFTKNWTPLNISLPNHGPTPPSNTPRSHNHLRSPSLSCPMSPRALKTPLYHPPEPPVPVLASPCKSPTPEKPLPSSASSVSSVSTSSSVEIKVPTTPKSVGLSITTPPRSPSSPPRSTKSFTGSMSGVPAPPPPSSMSIPGQPQQVPKSPTPAPPYYRTLTGSAAERKRTVAACRALRAQITRFEEAFIQLHGRPPKGAAERAPLATTYAQYREWKRAIRADAACRIQALVRGAVTRFRLSRTSSRLARIIQRNARSQSLLNKLSIPVEIGNQNEPLHNTNSPNAHNDPQDGVEVIISPTLPASETRKGVALSPSWQQTKLKKMEGLKKKKDSLINKNNPNHSASATNNASANANSSTNLPRRPPATPPSVSALPNNEVTQTQPQLPLQPSALVVQQPFDPFQMDPIPPPTRNTSFQVPITDLLSKKRELKNRLKQYDMDFAREYGRMPVKAEKEPIRHLYEQYNALKSQINQIESQRDPRFNSNPNKKYAPFSMASSSGTDSSDESSREQPSPHNSHRKTPQFPTTSTSSERESSSSVKNKSRTSTSNSSTSTSSPQQQQQQQHQQQQQQQHRPLPNGSPVNTPPGAPSMDLSQLKAEKGHLHQMLRSYEKDFYREHKRQVSSFADIRPVADQYRRYKEIKKQIAELQGGTPGSGTGERGVAADGGWG